MCKSANRELTLPPPPLWTPTPQGSVSCPDHLKAYTAQTNKWEEHAGNGKPVPSSMVKTESGKNPPWMLTLGGEFYEKRDIYGSLKCLEDFMGRKEQEIVEK